METEGLKISYSKEAPKTSDKDGYESITWTDLKTGIETELPYAGTISIVEEK